MTIPSLILLPLSLLFISCSPDEPKVVTYTPLQLEFLSKTSLDQRVYIETCMASKYSFWESCQREASELGKPVVQKSSSSALETAAGVAIGVGASKVLFK